MQMTDGEEVEAGHGLVRDAEFAKATRAEDAEEDTEKEPPPTDDEHGHGIKSGSTLRDATLAIIKSTIGPGILYMPKGFQEGGILFSLPMIILSYCLFSWGSTRILAAWHVERLSYAELMGRAFGPAGVSIVHFVIFCQQCGICLTYFIFVATNLRELCSSILGIDHVSLTTLCLWQLAVYIPLVMIRDIQNFAKTNLIANVLILYSLVVLSAIAAMEVFAGLACDDDNGGGDDGGGAGDMTATGHRQLVEIAGREPLSKHLLFNPSSFYLFIGTSTYIFEGNMALVVPLQGAMREDLKTQFPRLFVRTLGGIVVLYICFGLLNWMAYGDDTNAVLTTNLPEGHLKESVQLAYVIAVIFTFPLQLFPSIQTARSVLPKLLGKVSSALGCDDWMPNMENNTDAVGGVDRSALLPSGERGDADDGAATMRQQRHVPRAKRLRGIAGRVLIVVALCLIAIAERNSLTKILSLLGALLGIPLAYVFPSLIHLRMVPDSPVEVKRANFAVAALGVAFSVGCSVITLVTWNSDSSGGR